MSFTVAAVIRPGGHTLSRAWLTALRRQFPQITSVTLLDDSRTAQKLARRRRRNPALPAGETLTAKELTSSPELERVDYVWFLPPDSQPEAAALGLLHTRLSAADSLGVVGPKILSADGALVSVGATTTPQGARCTPVSPGEEDAGQHNRREDVFAVDEPGMLVKAEVVRRLGVPSEELSVSYRGLEYCDRVRRAGHRVEVVPEARLAIPSEGIRRYYSSPRPLPHKHIPRHENRYRLATTARGGSALAQLKLTVLALLKALGNLLSNSPDEAAWWLAAAWALPQDAGATRRLRRYRTGGSLPATMYATAQDLRSARRELAGVGGEIAADHRREDGAINTAGDLAEFSGITTRTQRSLLFHPLVAVLIATAAASALMFYRLIGPGAITGGAWARLDVPFTSVVARIFSPLLDVGLGTAAPADPLLSVLAVLSLPFAGNLDLMLRTVWIIALPLAALVMYLCAGRIVPASGIRALLALIWVGQPAFLISLHDGRVGTVLSWILAPAAVWALDRAIHHRSVAAAAACGLALTVIMAGSPFLILPIIAVVIAVMVIYRSTSYIWALLSGIGLSWPWLTAALRQPDALLTNPGLIYGYPQPHSFQLALGWATRPQLSILESWLPAAAVPWVLTALLLPLLAALVLAALRVQNSLTLLGLSVGCYSAGLAGAIVQAALEGQLTADGLAASFTGDSMLLLGLGFCGFTVAALWPLAYDRGSRIRNYALRGLIPAGALLMIGVFTLQALLVGTPIHRTTASPLPAFAAERNSGALGQQTLILESRNDQLYGQLVSPESNTILTTSTMHEARSISGHPFDRRPVAIDDADVALARVIGRLTSGSGDDTRTALDQLGIGFIIVRGPGASELAQTVAVSPGLARLGDTDQGLLYQVTPDGAPLAAASVVADDGSLSPVEMTDGRGEIPAGSGQRTFILAERAGLARVQINGEDAVPEEPRTGVPGWQAAYQLPEEAATVTVSYSSPQYAVGVGIGWVLFFIAVLVAIPFGRRTHPADERARA
ncbi:hypothetical protein [Brevibacterium otitidis]|uniref:Glycosyltransferase, GT2 family n=1 Tax=Brevibacterium otitidis TaxID=53364 RepID=A0ABV5X1G7_9MICO|nr:membrane protein [Brevibacterium otitidis]